MIPGFTKQNEYFPIMPIPGVHTSRHPAIKNTLKTNDMFENSNIRTFLVMFIAFSFLCAPAYPKSVLTKAEYSDRCEAIWNAQIISVLLGWEFEHKVKSVLWIDSIKYDYSLQRIADAGGCAPTDDDWYYEMATLNAFEKYGPEMSVEQLGQQWAENNVGVWGSSGQARQNILNGINAPISGHPKYNRLWFTMGAQNRCDLYGMLNPGMPNKAADMARNLQHINSYAEGTDGGVLVAAMIAMGFYEKNYQKIIRNATKVLGEGSPHRTCIEEVIALAGDGKTPQEIADFVIGKWGIEYPATNNTVANFGISTIALWFGEGDYLKSVNLAFSLADYTDADCNATNPAVVLAAIHGMKIFPRNLLDPLNNYMRGDMIGHVRLVPAVDTKISDLAARTVDMGEKILVANGAKISNEKIIIPAETKVKTQEAELFHPNEFVSWWDPSWELCKAGYGAPGGGHRGVRGGTFIEFVPDTVLVTFPRDEIQGVYLAKKIPIGVNKKMLLEVAADPGRAWKLEIYVNNQRMAQKLISGGPALNWPGITELAFPSPEEDYEACKAVRKYQKVEVDLHGFENQEAIVRVFQHTLVRNAYPGNAYWKRIKIM